MIYVLSLFFVFVETSLPLTSQSMVVILPFLAYISALKRSKAFFGLTVISLVLSFQNTNFVKIFIIFTLAYFAFSFLYTYMGYNRGAVPFISAVQLVIYLIYSYKHLSISYIVANLLGFMIVNLFYTRKSID